MKVIFLHLFCLATMAENLSIRILDETIANLDQDYFKSNKNASKILIGSNTVEHVNPNFLCAHPNLKIFEIYSNNKFAKITSDFFKCTPNLEEVLIYVEMEQDSLSQLRNLKAVSIEYQNFGQLRKNFLSGNKLKSLVLVQDHIEDMDEDVFVSVPNLEVLFLNDNGLKFTKPDMFKGLNKLDYLSLHSNILEEFPWDSFGVLPSLKKLDLTGSQLTHFDASQVKKHFPQLETLIIKRFEGDVKFYREELKKYNVTFDTIQGPPTPRI